MAEKVTLQFLGAAETVTGSKFLIKATDYQVLVDCGLFQGVKKLRLLNWEQPPIDLSKVNTVLLTHGHLDHCGYLPEIVKGGFQGKIIGTAPTLDIAEIILRDSARIQEEEAEKANREGYSKHKPARPLYNTEDVEGTLNRFHAEPLEKWIFLNDEVKFRFRYNGHILGATFIELVIHGKYFVFSGDIGREQDSLMYHAEKPDRADVIIMESTYGDSLHPSEERIEQQVCKIIHRTVEAGGTVIIPSFAVERAQNLMVLISRLQKEKKIPDIPVIMDSPMGSNVLDVFQKYMDWHKLPPKECAELTRRIRCVKDLKETYEVIADGSSKIVIAGSGMITGGRVLHYLQHYINKKKNTVMLVGYQAAGTRGRHLLEGVHEIKMFGKYVPVKARIEQVLGLSAHADQRELLSWLSILPKKPEKIFLIHGEPEALDTLRLKINETYGWDCTIPSLYQTEEIAI